MTPRAIRHYMVPNPHQVDESASLTTAITIVQSYDIRHLPVTADGRIVGVLHAENLRAALNIAQPKVTVSSICSRGIPVVQANTSLLEVVDEMLKKRLDYVIVEQAEKTVGIFTLIDALKLLQETLRGNPV